MSKYNMPGAARQVVAQEASEVLFAEADDVPRASLEKVIAMPVRAIGGVQVPIEHNEAHFYLGLAACALHSFLHEVAQWSRCDTIRLSFAQLRDGLTAPSVGWL